MSNSSGDQGASPDETLERDQRETSLDRRRFLQMTAAAAATVPVVGATGCGSDDGPLPPGPPQDEDPSAPPDDPSNPPSDPPDDPMDPGDDPGDPAPDPDPTDPPIVFDPE